MTPISRTRGIAPILWVSRRPNDDGASPGTEGLYCGPDAVPVMGLDERSRRWRADGPIREVAFRVEMRPFVGGRLSTTGPSAGWIEADRAFTDGLRPTRAGAAEAGGAGRGGIFCWRLFFHAADSWRARIFNKRNLSPMQPHRADVRGGGSL